MVPVHRKVLKPEDVQEANGAASVLHFLGGGLVNRSIDLVHNPDEEPPIDPLRGRAASSALGPATASQETGQAPGPSVALLQPFQWKSILFETPKPLLKLFPLPGAPFLA